jgi:sporulation protein YlmC with PRC-barrel domain
MSPMRTIDKQENDSMNSKQIRGLTVINLADGTQVGTVDQVFLDLAAKQVVGFSITDGVGPFGGGRDNAPTVSATAVHSLGPDALTLDDVVAAHAAWVGADLGAVVPLDDVVGRRVMTEGGANVGDVVSLAFDEGTFAITEVEVSPGFLKTNTHVPLARLIRIGQDVVVVADAIMAAEAPAALTA